MYPWRVPIIFCVQICLATAEEVKGVWGVTSQVEGYFPPGEPYQQSSWILILIRFFFFFGIVFINLFV